MKLLAPKLAYNFQECFLDDLIVDNMWDSVHAHHISIDEEVLTNPAIHYSLVQHCNFSDHLINAGDFMDSRFENCDFSNAVFDMSALHRVQFINCKFVGTKFIKSAFKSVQFDQCMLTYASFEACKFDTNLIHQCTLQQLEMYNCILKDVIFDLCELSAARFEKTPLKTVQMQSSHFETLIVEPFLLKGCKVSQQQALYFATFLGLEIE